MLTFAVADVDELITLLKTGGVRSVTRDRAKLNLPGVVVQIAGVRPHTMTTLNVRLVLLLVARDTTDTVTWTDLETLYNLTTAALEAAPAGVSFGEATGTLVTLPAAKDRPLPALALTVDLLTETEATP